MARGRRSGRRTDYIWAAFGDSIIALDQAQAASVATTGFVFSIAGTIVRIRGTIGATLDAGAVDEQVMLLLGLTVMNGDAFTVGIAPEIFPDGAGADEASWIWQGALYLSSGAEGAVVSDQLMGSLEIDTKAMRRVKTNDVLALILQAPPLLGVDQTGTIDLSYYIHVLVGS